MLRIVIDSTTDILPHQAARLGVEVIPLQVTFEDGEIFRDGLDLTPDEFYTKLAACNKLPLTSQPSPELFMNAFEAAQQAGDEVIAILLSSKVSGTYQSAKIAADTVGYNKVHVVDGTSATLGNQLLVHLALQLRRQGLAAADILPILEKEKHKVRILAVVDDLKYFRKGGRLSGAEAFAGSLLGIKPVICVKNGEVSLAGKARGMPGAYVALFKMIEQEGGLDAAKEYIVGYTAHRRAAEPIVRYTTANLGLNAPQVCHIGTVIGTHAGPGAAGIAFFIKNEWND